MKLNVPKVEIVDAINFASVSEILEQKSKSQEIAWVEWKEFSYKPKVFFRMAHCDSLLFIKFFVKEKHVMAKQFQPNSPTHTDSCVEFFIDPIQNGNYYNFEFNCIGTTHLAFGPDRHQREFINPKKIASKIKTWSTLGAIPFEEQSGDFYWEMVVVIPASIFIYHPNFSFSNLSSAANLYKCGDDTSQPHYLSWNPVLTPKPDFHQPKFFGEIYFE